MQTLSSMVRWQGAVAFSLVILIDQVTKWVFSGQGLVNTGVSFGLGERILAQQHMVLLLGVFLIGMWFYSRCFWRQSQVVTGAFFGGAISNMLDRLAIGGVRDWLPLPFVGVTNNIADLTIFFCLLFLLWKSIAGARKGSCAVC